MSLETLTPPIEEIGERLPKRDFGPPSGGGLGSGGITHQPRDVRAPESPFIHLDRDLAAAQIEELLDDLGDGDAAAGADVEDLAGMASIGGQPTGADRITNICEVSNWV